MHMLVKSAEEYYGVEYAEWPGWLRAMVGEGGAADGFHPDFVYASLHRHAERHGVALYGICGFVKHFLGERE